RGHDGVAGSQPFIDDERSYSTRVEGISTSTTAFILLIERSRRRHEAEGGHSAARCAVAFAHRRTLLLSDHLCRVSRNTAHGDAPEPPGASEIGSLWLVGLPGHQWHRKPRICGDSSRPLRSSGADFESSQSAKTSDFANFPFVKQIFLGK